VLKACFFEPGMLPFASLGRRCAFFLFGDPVSFLRCRKVIACAQLTGAPTLHCNWRPGSFPLLQSPVNPSPFPGFSRTQCDCLPPIIFVSPSAAAPARLLLSFATGCCPSLARQAFPKTFSYRSAGRTLFSQTPPLSLPFQSSADTLLCRRLLAEAYAAPVSRSSGSPCQ